MSEQNAQTLVTIFGVVGVFTSVLAIFCALALLFRPRRYGGGRPARPERVAEIMRAKEAQETRELPHRWNVPAFSSHDTDSSCTDSGGSSGVGGCE